MLEFTEDTNLNLLVISKKAKLEPGVYQIEIIENDRIVFNEEFSWGVLAINTNKSIYTPNETVHFEFGVSYVTE